ncbi:MAG: hypothetical protein GF383_15660 [Candidatus Lokiarchaeota archaeon]|nr:hypothetical protein [Candidatus Lokiarchaeota archaeon]MBD3343012.1 hypothetical protein [Candidatus Lokiarchaeota archaeon]
MALLHLWTHWICIMVGSVFNFALLNFYELSNGILNFFYFLFFPLIMVKIENFLEIKRGNFPVIVSVPHGGEHEYPQLPKRNDGIMGVDKSTISLAKLLIKFIGDISEQNHSKSWTPSYLFSYVPRRNIDLNRSKKKAYLKKSKLAKKIYKKYHKKIKSFIKFNLKTYGKSLLIDIHGFEKYKRPEGYREVEIVLGTNNLKSITVQELKKRDKNKNIRGRIIKHFLNIGVPIAPGHPRRDEYVLTGGYITQKYGASNIEGSQSLQIEFSDQIRIYNKSLKRLILKELALVLVDQISSSTKK